MLGDTVSIPNLRKNDIFSGVKNHPSNPNPIFTRVIQILTSFPSSRAQSPATASLNSSKPEWKSTGIKQSDYKLVLFRPAKTKFPQSTAQPFFSHSTNQSYRFPNTIDDYSFTVEWQSLTCEPSTSMPAQQSTLCLERFGKGSTVRWRLCKPEFFSHRVFVHFLLITFVLQ